MACGKKRIWTRSFHFIQQVHTCGKYFLAHSLSSSFNIRWSYLPCSLTCGWHGQNQCHLTPHKWCPVITTKKDGEPINIEELNLNSSLRYFYLERHRTSEDLHRINPSANDNGWWWNLKWKLILSPNFPRKISNPLSSENKRRNRAS